MAEEAKAPEEPQEGKTPEAEGDAAAAAGDAAKAKKKKMLLIVSGALAAVGIAVAIGVVFFMGGENKPKAEDAAAAAVKDIAVYDLPEFTLNLMGEDPGSQHFLKIKLSLELSHASDSAAMEKLLPRLQDDWGGFLRQLRPNDLQGSAALQRLKEGLLRRANQTLAPVTIRAVYIRELLVQ